MKKRTWLAIALAGVLVLTGCGGGNTSGSTSGNTSGGASETTSGSSADHSGDDLQTVTVGVSWHEMQSVNVTVWSEWLHTYAEEIGPEYGLAFDWVELTGDGTTVQEASNIQDLITQHVDVMVIWCNDVNVIGTSIKAAQEEGIKVITIDHQDVDKLADVHVGQDTLDQAIVAAEGLVEVLKEDGVENAQAIELFGSLGDSNSVNRSDGWHQVEEESGAWTTVVTEPTEWATENFKTATVNALAAYPDANVLFVASDFAFSAVQAALEESGRWFPRGEEGHMYICTQDINPQAYQAFVDGYIDVGVPFDNISASKKIIEVIADMMTGKEVEKEYWIQTPLVTADNIETETTVWARDYLD
ncbi:MAG: substrate-binding domain-containing protein [Clostridiales bacterium]|nr:substrate-binding domain-containing protein [Clostridiales bacterium]